MPAQSTTKTADTRKRPYTYEMVLVHRALRRESSLLPRLIRTVPVCDTARAGELVEYVGTYVGGLEERGPVGGSARGEPTAFLS